MKPRKTWCRSVLFVVVLLMAQGLGASSPIVSQAPLPGVAKGDAPLAADTGLYLPQDDGTLRVWSSDFLEPRFQPVAQCAGEPPRQSAVVWEVSEAERGEVARAREARGVAADFAGTQYAYCDCTLTGVTANATSCAPDCGSDCDEGHDGTTCHVHQYQRLGPGGYRTFIDDFVDCCECTSSTTYDCGNTVATNNCGGCSSSPWYCPGSGGYASCCVSTGLSYVRQRRVNSSHTVGSYVVRIDRGTSGSRSNKLYVKQGGKEDCDGGSRDGWQTYSFPPDRDVSTFSVGSYVSYNWSCGADLPSLSGSGYSCTCYQGTAQSCLLDGYCDAGNAENDPDCQDCPVADGICTPGCGLYIPDPDCPCDVEGGEPCDW